jgi:hypothetical protein
MSCCSESETSWPVFKKWAPSTFPATEKLQQLPHTPWSLTGVTAPFATQSTGTGAAVVRASGSTLCSELRGCGM